VRDSRGPLVGVSRQGPLQSQKANRGRGAHFAGNRLPEFGDRLPANSVTDAGIYRFGDRLLTDHRCAIHTFLCTTATEQSQLTKYSHTKNFMQWPFSMANICVVS
jgi:hypothetical protein